MIFRSSLDGKLSETSSGNYLPEIQSGPFTHYEQIGDRWEAQSADGMLYVFW